jgi:hypothetical protein
VKVVSRFEADLLRLLYFFLKREPPERGLPLVGLRQPAPPCLSRAAVDLVRDALAKGCTHLLALRGGWRDERHPRGETVTGGRLWKRTAPADLGLKFSRQTLAFLIWITAARPGDDDKTWQSAEEELTPADRLLLYFAQEGLREAPTESGAAKLWSRQPFARHGLCRLAFPKDFPEAAEVVPNFAPWMEGLGACIVEALQPELAARLVQTEIAKERLGSPQSMLRLGLAQETALTSFLETAERANRPDLIRFLLIGATELLTPGRGPAAWIGGLRTEGRRLADRAAAYQAALAFLRCFDRLQSWERRARGVGYFDEGYAAAQLWKADWERYGGDALAERARSIVGQLDPLQLRR